ncbi:MAG: BON domain-containing protein [Alphaproteobacteria bacterium]
MRILTITALGLAAIAVSGCALTTAGVSPGDERNFARSLDDLSAARAVKARMTRAIDYKLSGVDVEVAQGIVVLTGYTPTSEDKIEAERIAWSAPNVTQVGNEIVLDGKRGIFQSTKDTVLSGAIRTRLTAEKDVKARNVNIETNNGVVYLLGVARSPEELEKIAYLAATTKGTQEVISYMMIPEAVMQSANFTTTQSYAAQPLSPPAYVPQPYSQAPLAGASPQQRPLPGALTRAPDTQGLGAGAPQMDEPYYRDPKTGERIFLAPGTKTVPYIPGGSGADDAPHYIDPDTGKKIMISYLSNR